LLSVAQQLRLPSQLCSGGGRAVNAPRADWPKTLRGEAAQIYLRWERDLNDRSNTNPRSKVAVYAGDPPRPLRGNPMSDGRTDLDDLRSERQDMRRKRLLFQCWHRRTHEKSASLPPNI
jgi:hypothetical protein